MIKIEVKSTDLEPFSGVSKASGKPFSFRNQQAYAFTVDKNGVPHPYPELIKLTLDDNQLPYPVGMYWLAPQAVYVGKFGRLELGRTALVPVQNSTRAVA